MTPRPPRHAPRFWRLTAGAQHGTLTVKSEGRVVGAHAQPVPPQGGGTLAEGRGASQLSPPPPLPPRERDPGTPGGAKRDRSREQRPLTPGREQGAWPSGKGHGSSEHRIRSAGSILVYSIDSGLRYWSQSGVSILTCSIDPCLRDRSRAVALIRSAGTCGTHTGDHAPGYLAGRDGVLHRP